MQLHAQKANPALQAADPGAKPGGIQAHSHLEPSLMRLLRRNFRREAASHCLASRRNAWRQLRIVIRKLEMRRIVMRSEDVNN